MERDGTGAEEENRRETGREGSGMKPLKQFHKKEFSAEVEVQQRIKRLERVCLLLGICVLLLGIFGIRSNLILGRTIGILKFLAEQIKLICQQVDAVCQGI